MGTALRTLSLVGSSACSEEVYGLAFETGRLVARGGAVLVCGGGSGVMAAGCAGAKAEGGTTVGILPTAHAGDNVANPYVDIVIPTGLGQARNQVVVLSGGAVIAVGGGWGTLSEIALAQKHGIPVVLLQSWALDLPEELVAPGLMRTDTPSQAVELAFKAAAVKVRRTAGGKEKAR